MEPYLNKINDFRFRTAVSRFRLSSHNLQIEIGRHQHIERNRRLCTQCNMQMVEDENHMLLVCPFYRDLRAKYFKPFFCRWPTINKFKDIMTSTNNKTLLNLSKFIFHSFNKRE